MRLFPSGAEPRAAELSSVATTVIHAVRRIILTISVLAAAVVRVDAHARLRAGHAPSHVDDAVKMALDHNVDLSAERLDPQISDTRVAAAAGVFRPTFNSSVNRNNQLQPPASFLIPTPTRTDAITSSAGVSQ